MVEVLVVRHGGGGVNVDVQSYLAGTDHLKADELQNIMMFDASGNLAKSTNERGESVDMAQMSDSVQRCMRSATGSGNP
jgi:hypothetical protein